MSNGNAPAYPQEFGLTKREVFAMAEIGPKELEAFMDENPRIGRRDKVAWDYIKARVRWADALLAALEETA